MNEDVLTESEKNFICTELDKLSAELFDQTQVSIANTEIFFADEAKRKGFNFSENPANSGYLTAYLIQKLLDCLCQGDKGVAKVILVNEARRLGVGINTLTHE